MANTLITPTVIARLVLMHLRNNLVMAKNVNRELKREFVKVGSTVNIRRPVKFEAKDGATRINQDVQEANTSISVNKQKHVSFPFSSQDLTLTVEKFSERYAQPAGIALSNIVDSDGCDLYKRTAMHVGTAGTTPSSFKNFAAPLKRLKQNAVPPGMRQVIVDPEAELNAADMLRNTQIDDLGRAAVRSYTVGRIGDAPYLMDQNIKSHTTSSDWGTPLVNGANQDVTYANASHSFGPVTSTLNVDGLTANGTINEGDRFTISGVNAVNPVSKADLGFVQEFVVVEDASVNGSNEATLKIAPAIITSGPYQTVSAAPADNAAITEVSDYTANLAFHRDAFGLAMVPLELPDGANFKARESHDDVSVRVVKDFDIDNDEDIIRYDILYGWKMIHGDLACVLLG